MSDYQLKQPGLSRYSKASKQQLKELSDTANSEHELADGCWKGYLDHAKRAGEALNEAKKILGKRGRWGRWRKHNFKGSEETARCYARIAREWNDRRLVNARAQGVTIDSIYSVLKILRNEPIDLAKNWTPIERKVSQLREFIRREFTEYLKELDMFELEVFNDNVVDNWEDRTLFTELHKRLKELVCVVDGPERYWSEEDFKAHKKERHEVSLINKEARRKKKYQSTVNAV